MQFDPHPGALIEFDAGDDHRLALITGKIGGKRLLLHTVSGDEMRTTPAKITFFLGTAPPDDLEGAKRKLQALEEAVEEHRGQAELPILWEFTRDEATPMSPAELAEVMFADDDPAAVLGMLRALRGDAIFFKGRRDGLFEPRPPELVERLQEQQLALKRKEQAHELAIKAIVDALELPVEERAEFITARMSDDDNLRDKIHLLQDFAAQGEDFHRRQQAEELLDELVQARGGRQFQGRMGLKAFFLMRELDLWDEHFNLALRRHHISPNFSDELLAEAEELASQDFIPEEWRQDLTHLTTITIDALESKDLDDALSCQPTLDGGFELFIHIADPSAIIPIDSPLDREARKRGTSVYLPTGPIPMFPDTLSEGPLSLNQGVVRPALTTHVVYSEELSIEKVALIPSLVQVDKRLSYDEADELLKSNQPGRFADLLANLQHIADENYTRRTEQGAFSFDLPETQIFADLSQDPPAVSIRAVETNQGSRALISELMILNNELVGQFLRERSIPAIYRTQESPDEPLEDDEILAIPQGPARFFAQIRRMKPGDFSTAPELHFGLGIYSYAQASSPIRRYADLLCQRQIKAFLRDEPLPYDEQDIMEATTLVATAVAQATDAERDSQRYWLHFALAQRVDEPLDAIVTEIKDERTGRASVYLVDCAYRSNCTLRTKLATGDTVSVVVERADARRDVLTLRQAPPDSPP